MKICRIVGLTLLLCLLSLPGIAQRDEHRMPLSDTQILGRRLFQQRCAVCHTPVMVISKPYGPLLNRTRVEGREDTLRALIREGATGLMPGFKYGLEEREISAIIAFLKTVEPPSRPITNWTAEH